MNLREAAQQALEFIVASNKDSPFWLVPASNLNKTVTALRAALADTQDWDEVEALRASLREHMAEIHRLNECLTWEQHRAEHVGTHGPGCAEWGAKHYECLLRAHEALKMRIESTKMGEPVAWAVITKGRKLYKAASTKESAERKAAQQIDKLGVEWECSVVPLYLAAPKREPLTEEQIEFRFGKKPTRYMLFLIRSTERAHGIGGEE